MRFLSIAASAVLWSSTVRALMKRAAVAEMSRETTDSRMALIVIGACRSVTCRKPGSTVSKESKATPAAIIVRPATTPNAIWSLVLMPKAASTPRGGPQNSKTPIHRSLQFRDIGAHGHFTNTRCPRKISRITVNKPLICRCRKANP